MSMEASLEAIKAKVSGGSGIGATVKFDCGDDGVIFIDGNVAATLVAM